MKRVYVFSYDGIRLDIDKLNYENAPEFSQRLITIQNAQADLGIYEYIYDLDEYRGTRVKRLYVKGDSTKLVPRQVWNIETRTFTTKPEKFLDKYNIEFEEF